MMTTLILYPMPPGRGADAATMRRMIEEAAPRYAAIPGLIRKSFLSGGGQAGGVYEWQSRAAAEAFLTQDWARDMAQRFGAEPSVQWFDTAAVLDCKAERLHLAERLAAAMDPA